MSWGWPRSGYRRSSRSRRVISQTYVRLAQTDTGALIYVRSSAGQLAGSTPRGPARLPSSGSIGYRGRSYEVYSFPAPSSVGPVRVYALVTS